MEAKRWAEVRALFDELVELEPENQAARLAVVSARDPEMARAVQSLLAADPDAESRLAGLEVPFTPSHPKRAPSRSEPPPPDPLGLSGRTISHFRIIEPLATGGMGVVYRAEDTQLARPVALKFPLREHRLDRQDRDRFLREARTAGALDHPNLCSIYEAGETEDGQLFIAMALYEGETLKQRIARAGPLPIESALDIATQIAQGLGAVHRAGIIHRDLKPANVMLLPGGGVKILDFGVAKVADVALTVTQGTLGTVSYMAPEQVRGGALSSRTDLWALGVLLYEMLTGSRPFEGDHGVEIAHAIVYLDPISPGELSRGVGSDIEKLVRKLLTKEVAQRPTSTESVIAELAVLRRGSAAGPHLRETSTPSRRSWSKVALATALLLALPAAGFTTWMLRPDVGGEAVHPRIVAVLPFDDPGNPSDSRYLGVGIADAVASHLGVLGTVAVPTVPPQLNDRASGVTSGGKEPEPTIVTGSVRRTDDGVWLEIRLLEAGTGRQLWTRSFGNAGTELLELQRAVSQAVVAALRLELTDSERTSLARLPTSNSEAYEHFLRARAIDLTSSSRDGPPPAIESLQRAQSSYARARTLDPEFAPARARLALSHMEIALRYDTTQARRDQGRLEAEAALRLWPKLSEAHEALVSYWDLAGEPARAFDELQLAIADAPNRGYLHLRLGLRLRRMGRWEEAVSEFEHAIRLDPDRAAGHTTAAVTFSRMRRYEDAVKHWDRVIALDPSGDPTPHIIRGHAFLRLEGSVDSLEAALTRVPASRDDRGMTTFARYTVLRIQRRPADAIRLLDGAQHPISWDEVLYRPVTLLRAPMLRDIGDHAGSRESYEAARAMLVESVAAHPEEPSIRIALSLAYAGLGRRAEAIREARQAIAIAPLVTDNVRATAAMGGAIEVFAQLGEHDAALELLELLLAIPAGREVSVPLLKIDPMFDPLRGDPRFGAMMERFSRT